MQTAGAMTLIIAILAAISTVASSTLVEVPSLIFPPPFFVPVGMRNVFFTVRAIAVQTQGLTQMQPSIDESYTCAHISSDCKCYQWIFSHLTNVTGPIPSVRSNSQTPLMINLWYANMTGIASFDAVFQLAEKVLGTPVLPPSVYKAYSRLPPIVRQQMINAYCSRTIPMAVYLLQSSRFNPLTWAVYCHVELVPYIS